MGKKKNIRVGFLAIIVCVLVTVYAAPCGAELIDIFDSEPDVTSDVYWDDFLMVYGTLNLKAGAVVGDVWIQPGGTVNMDADAYVLGGMYVDEGTTVKFRGGSVAYGIYIFSDPDPQPVITVYGTDFEVTNYVEWNADKFIPASGSASVLTGKDENLEVFSLGFYGPGDVPVYLVNQAPGLKIDIKPGSDTNVINLKSKGVVSVAVLTADGFDAVAVDPTTALFAEAAPVRWTLEDVNGDGDEDMLFHFRTQELELSEDSTEAKLTAQLTGSLTSQSTDQASGVTTVSGTDKVRILSSKSKK
ncbi:MAG: hypothetical protein JSW66_05195 [Phycisphaerales bacterium]|nr:MAG: hypothetical protein JSW66_05195 [Phycisphaerales bacterium]